jgi:hypothetical protein
VKVNFGGYHIIGTAIVMMAAAAVLGIFAIVILLPQAYATTDDTCNSNTNDNAASCTHQRHGSPKDTTPFVLPFP